LYYNIADFSVVDYVEGMQDLERGVVRMIGDPLERFREDPVRILRAVRFAAKLGFRLDEATAAAIPTTAPLLSHVSSARLFDEALKLLIGGYGLDTFALLRQLQLLNYLFPLTEAILAHPELHQEADRFILSMLRNTDTRLAQDKTVNPAFMIAVMLWYPRLQRSIELHNEEVAHSVTIEQATNEVLGRQVKYLAIPKRFTAMVREIWSLQFHFERRRPHRVLSLVYSPRFRAAYDFLLLRAEIDPKLAPLADWWTQLSVADEEKRHELIKELASGVKKKRRRKKKTINSSS
jgi:poly(A) polymerase